MPEELDAVARYGKGIGLEVSLRTILVEGTTDADLFTLASTLETRRSGARLLGDSFAIIAAGQGDDGGTNGVVRELTCLRGMARTCLLPNGRPKYRFVSLFDNDMAGRGAIKTAREIDRSLLEYKDLFRLQPVMPLNGDLDPESLRRRFELENTPYKGLDWEIEDLLPESLLAAFADDQPTAVSRISTRGGRVHRDFTRDGKARLHRFIREHAVVDDLDEVIGVLRALRFYLNIKT